MGKHNGYRVSVYCPVGDLLGIADYDAFEKKFDWFAGHTGVEKAYLETYRGGQTITREQMEKAKAFFASKGMETAGGITTVSPPGSDGGFTSFCYTDPRARAMLKEVVEFTASLFDEIILDDFFFTNCRCESCAAEKGARSWAAFRLELMREVSENLVIGPAKAINPKVKMVIKYPNWYEDYQETGYNLKDQPGIFDGIHTGTETRDPMYTDQHLPKYLGYFIMRYLENAAPGRNGGGWFDPFACNYNLNSYVEQAYLTQFGKARESTIFCLSQMLNNPAYSLFAPALGQAYRDMDAYMDMLGKPIGTACYLPYHSTGEDYLHNYLGMAGIPLEPYPEYPAEAKSVFLTAGAACDAGILDKIERSLLGGADVIVTSGFVARVQDMGFTDRFVNIRDTGHKALSNRFTYSDDGGLSFGGFAESAAKILFPRLTYHTNDSWALAAALGEDSGVPLLTRVSYGKGRLYALTIPEDSGELYEYPRELLKTIRAAFAGSVPVTLDGRARIALFAYDNGTFIVRSFLPNAEKAALEFDGAALRNLIGGGRIAGETGNGRARVKVVLEPGVNYVYRIEKA